jgi:hypothetical protein
MKSPPRDGAASAAYLTADELVFDDHNAVVTAVALQD